MSSFGQFESYGSFVSSNTSRRTEDSRIGTPWSHDEDNRLLEEIGSKMDLKEIASIHKRTTKGIKLRLIHHAIKMMDTKGVTIETVAGHFNLLRSEIEEFTNKKTKEKKAAEFKDKQPEYHDKYLELLTDIRDTLKILVEKVSEPSIQSVPTISMSHIQSLSNIPSPSSIPSPKKVFVKPINKINSLPKIASDHAFTVEPNKLSECPDISLKMPFPTLKVDIC